MNSYIYSILLLLIMNSLYSGELGLAWLPLSTVLEDTFCDSVCWLICLGVFACD